jgi:hypothetical protein
VIDGMPHAVMRTCIERDVIVLQALVATTKYCVSADGVTVTVAPVAPAIGAG